MQKAEKELTLRMDAALVERAERYAEERGTSVPELVAGYLAAVTRPTPLAEEEGAEALGPVTRSLIGALSGEKENPRDALPESRVDEDLRAEYHRYLEEKHR